MTVLEWKYMANFLYLTCPGFVPECLIFDLENDWRLKHYLGLYLLKSKNACTELFLLKLWSLINRIGGTFGG